jgi:hypothetical protein
LSASRKSPRRLQRTKAGDQALSGRHGRNSRTLLPSLLPLVAKEADPPRRTRFPARPSRRPTLETAWLAHCPAQPPVRLAPGPCASCIAWKQPASTDWPPTNSCPVSGVVLWLGHGGQRFPQPRSIQSLTGRDESGSEPPLHTPPFCSYMYVCCQGRVEISRPSIAHNRTPAAPWRWRPLLVKMPFCSDYESPARSRRLRRRKLVP